MTNKKVTAANAGEVLPHQEDGTRSNSGNTLTAEADALSRMRELIAGEPELDSPTDDAFLLKFLRGRKYNVHEAFRTLKKYFQVRRDNPNIFSSQDPDSSPLDIACQKHQLVTLSRKKDPKGRAVILLKIGAWNIDACPLDEFFRTGIAHVEYAHFDEKVQLNGIVSVLDISGLSINHLRYYTPAVIKRLVNLVQDCFPLRLKGVYIINNPPLFDAIFTIAKPFMNVKMARRIHFFGYDLNKLQNLVPEDIIPKEGGGALESYDYSAMEEELKSHTGYFREILKRGYHDGPIINA